MPPVNVAGDLTISHEQTLAAVYDGLMTTQRLSGESWEVAKNKKMASF
jgi:hypothetical protein